MGTGHRTAPPSIIFRGDLSVRVRRERARSVPQSQSLIEETTAAAQGCLALVTGNRAAPGYFDFSLRGLVGSFIAFLVATLLSALVPLLLQTPVEPGGIARGLLMAGVLVVLQIGFAALVLRQIGRLDGLLPYVVADNWCSFFVTLLSIVLAVLGLVGDIVMLATVVLVLILEINIARLIVTLRPLHIAFLLGAQFIGVSLVLLAFGGLLPVSPDAAADFAAQ